MTLTATSSSDGSSTYVYDAENRLVSVTGGTNVTLAYDPLGRLWQYSGPQSGTLRFVYDGDRLTVEYNGSGVVQRTHGFGPGVDEPLVSYEVATPMRRFYHADQQGSIVAVADENGNALNISSYDEWGVPAAGDWGRFRYTGQVWLPDVGLYYYKARMYSSRLGRFLQTDPVGYSGGVNLYDYVNDDPVDGRDPTGLAPSDDPISFEASQGRGFRAPTKGEAALVLGGGAAIAACALGGCEAVGVAYRLYRFGRALEGLRSIPAQTEEALDADIAGLRSSEASYERNVAEHEQKIAEYRRNPDAFDNKGTLARNPEHRAQIIQGRIRKLEKDLAKNRNELAKVRERLKKLECGGC